MTRLLPGRALGRAALLCALLLLGATRGGRALAQDATTDAEDVAEQVERQAAKGLSAFRRGNHEEALARAERLGTLDPKSPVPRVLRARVYARTGRYEEALALAAEAASVSVYRYSSPSRLGP